MKKSFSSLPATSLIALLSLLGLSASVRADSGTWLSSPADNNWNNNANWTGATYPNGPLDVATFATSNTTNVHVTSSITSDGITFDPSASAFTITVNGGAVPNVVTMVNSVTNNSGITQHFV